MHEVVTLSPSDGLAPALARGGPVSALDADGDRPAYSSPACYPGRFEVWRQSARDGGTADFSRRTCPLVLDDTANVVRSRRVRYDVACPTLIPTRPRERCSISVEARIGRPRLGRRRSATMTAGDLATLRWPCPLGSGPRGGCRSPSP